MRQIIMFHLFILMPFTALSQATISGKVQNTNGESLRNANVVIKASDSQKIIAFSITRADGLFSLQTKPGYDTLMLEVSKLGFSNQLVLIENKNQTINFILEEGETKLKELVVKAPPIRRSNDTLSYSVSEFQSQTDRSIGDVIKKLPGIDVDSRGEIYYQGEPINRYYVEDMNLLSRNYNLVNENLPHGKVATVQIYENHQPIRVLDSLSISSQAAINIKLRNKVTKTGNFLYGIGYKPVLYEINITPMVFTPNFQFLGSLQSNNSGQDIQPVNYDFDFMELSGKESWLSLLSLNPPLFNSKRWMDNLSHMGSLNVLKRKKSDLEMKLNSSLVLDRQSRNGNDIMTYFLEKDTISYRDEIQSKFKTNGLSVQVELNKNIPKKYFNNKISFEREWNTDDGFNNLLDRSYNQKLNTGNLKLTNRFNRIFSKKDKVYNLFSTLLYAENHQNLQVNFISADSLAAPIQNFNHYNFSTLNYVKFDFKLSKKYSVGAEAGSKIELSKINTELGNHEITNGLINNFNWNSFKTYFSGNMSYFKRKWEARLNLPVAHYYISYKTSESFKRFSRISPEPWLNITYNHNQSTKFFGVFRYNETFSSLGDWYEGNIMSNYLTINQRDSDFKIVNRLSGGLSFRYNDVISGVTANAGVNMSHQIQNQQLETYISSDGSVLNQLGDSRNISSVQSARGSISKYWFKLRTTTTIGFSYSVSERHQFVNNVLRNYTIRRTNPELRISYGGWSKGNITYSSKLSHSVNRETTQNLAQFQQEVNAAITLSKAFSLLIAGEHYLISSLKKESFFFGDLTIRFTLPKTSQDFELGIVNLFNQKDFDNFILGDYYNHQIHYELRPRQFVLRGRFSF